MKLAIKECLKKFWIELKLFFKLNWKIVLTWLAIILFIVLGYVFKLKKAVIWVIVFVFGIVSQAFTAFVSVVGLIPVVGPIIAKVLMLPIFWVLNALGYFVSVVAIKKGYKKEVINYRVLTIIFLIGFAVGFVVAQFLK